jgi:hypothetical protein
MMDDARRITDELVQLIDIERKDVAIVAHSYGGIDASQGVEARFNKASREAHGKSGGVLRIIYLAAFLVPIGSSLLSPLGGLIPPCVLVDVSDFAFPILV